MSKVGQTGWTNNTILDGECLLDLTTLLESLNQEVKKELDK